MQEEINRIKNKDFSNIDERLYGALGFTNELDTTIAQLAELQRYLKSQIDNIEDESQKEAALKASQVVMSMNFEGCQKVQAKCRCKGSLMEVMDKIKKMGKKIKSSKQSIERQLKSCYNDIKQSIIDKFQQIQIQLTRKNNQIGALRVNTQSLQDQITDLTRKNNEIQLKLSDWEAAEKRLKDRVIQQYKKPQVPDLLVLDTIKTEHNRSVKEGLEQPQRSTNGLSARYNQKYFSKTEVSAHKQTRPQSSIHQFLKQFNDEGPRLPMPLRRQNSLTRYGTVNVNLIQRKSSTNNVLQPFVALNLNGKQSVQKKLMQKKLSPKKIMKNKQNQLLKLKGSDQVSRKSTQKLKVFSINEIYHQK